jgi:hypothetical protein
VEKQKNPDFPLSPAASAVEFSGSLDFLLDVLFINCLGGLKIGDEKYAAEKITAATYQPYGNGRGNWDRHI